MTSSEILSERERLILQAVVHTYITTAEPVGSRSIVKRFGLDLSPATVRNAMADLEEAGYLQQLHTSSGRVPTDDGYRYYVDFLMKMQDLTIAERARIERELSERLSDADEVLRQSCRLLALVSNQAGMVEAPDDADAQVTAIDLMPLSSNRVAVLIGDSLGRVRTQVVGMDNALDGAELSKLTHFLNDNFRGVKVEGLASSIQSRLRIFMDDQRQLAELAVKMMNLLPPQRSKQLYLEGTAHLFEQPEFRNVEHAHSVFSLFEERDSLAELLRSHLNSDDPNRARIIIGRESAAPGLEDVSVVAAPYSVGDKRVGMLGVLGPRRMPYSKLTAVVGHTAAVVSRFLTRLAS